MKSKFIFISGLLLGLTIIALGVYFLRPRPFHGMVMQSPELAYDFSLNASNGKTVSLKDYRGKLVVLYFGYTFCPDVCPASLSTMKGALELLGRKADEVQFIMISVDPERDTPERLGEYVTYFDPSFIGVTGEPDKLAEIAALYGIYFQKHEGTAATGYLVDHTATMAVIDQEGYLKLILPFGITSEDVASDLKKLLQ
ncbi:MAG TPA: SCO family protein [Anaerolineales bacterium]|nr:SCO family protein [Anaerolineales bacterium]